MENAGELMARFEVMAGPFWDKELMPGGIFDRKENRK